MTTRGLAKWVSELHFDDLPGPVVEKAKTVVFDFLGACLFTGGRKPWGKTIISYAANNGAGCPEATILSSGQRTLAAQAALANGTLAEGFELGDVHAKTATRPFPMVVPPALALVEARKQTGKLLIQAIVAGYEVNTRIGLAISPSQRGRPMIRRGLYLPSLIGTFGAASAAGKAIGLGDQKMTWALGIAGALTGGYFQGHEEGAWTRRLNGGMAPERGVTAALLAELGFVGPEEPLEGEYGFYRVFAENEYDPAVLTAGIGSSFKILETWLKSYPMNSTLHGPVEALLKLMNENGISHQDIAAISASFHQYLEILAKKKIKTVVSAQFSLPFALAVASVHRKVTVNEFTDDALRDPAVLEMIDRIEVAYDPALYERVAGESQPGRVVVRTKDGRRFTKEVLYPKGHPLNPMSCEEIKRKFATLTEGLLTESEQDTVYEMVMDLESLGNISGLMKLCSLPSLRNRTGHGE